VAVQRTWGRQMFDLIEELKRVRRLAEQVDDGILLYLLDMAIVEARSKASACNDNLVAPDPVREQHQAVCELITRTYGTWDKS
jgi:hypothetical protein